MDKWKTWLWIDVPTKVQKEDMNTDVEVGVCISFLIASFFFTRKCVCERVCLCLCVCCFLLGS